MCQGSCYAFNAMLQANPRGSGGTAAETKEKYELKSAGGGTYNVAGGTQLAVSSTLKGASQCLKLLFGRTLRYKLLGASDRTAMF